MSSVNVNIRMDADLKKEFEKFCNDVGMNMTTAFTIFARRTVRDQNIPFEVSAEGRRDAVRQVETLLEQKASPSSPEEKFEEIKSDWNI